VILPWVEQKAEKIGMAQFVTNCADNFKYIELPQKLLKSLEVGIINDERFQKSAFTKEEMMHVSNEQKRIYEE
jgi:hypothetical protein